MTINLIALRRTDRPKHRAVDEVARLRRHLAAADKCIRGLRLQVETANEARDWANAKAVSFDEAVSHAAACEQAMDEMRSELLKLRAHSANCQAVTVPAGERDIDPDDHPTEPVNVKTLWEALRQYGPVIPGPVASAAHVPSWAVTADDTEPARVLADRLVQGVAS